MTAEGHIGVKLRTGFSSDRIFFGGMGVLLLGGVFLGFAPTYYLKTPDAPPLTPLWGGLLVIAMAPFRVVLKDYVF